MTGLRLTVEQRLMIRRLSAEGLSLRQVARQVSCSHEGVSFVRGGHKSRWTRLAWGPGQGRLTVAEREEISLGVHRGETFGAIASRLGRAVSTVSREVAANGGRAGYRAWRAHERAREQARRPKRPKLACPRLAAQVTAWLEEWWSPAEIARRLRIGFPTDPMMWGEPRDDLPGPVRAGSRGAAPGTGPLSAHRANHPAASRPNQQHGHRYIPMLLQRMAAGDIPTRHLTTHPLPLAEAVRGYEMFKDKEDGCVRAVFHP